MKIFALINTHLAMESVKVLKLLHVEINVIHITVYGIAMVNVYLLMNLALEYVIVLIKQPVATNVFINMKNGIVMENVNLFMNLATESV